VKWPSASSAIGTIAIGKTGYVGRFAPSPTGPLHFGSLLAATASYLEARRHGGQWLLRIEDIDPPRQQDGAAELIVAALECYGFEWDGPIIYQSASRPEHDQAIQQLLDKGLAYHCSCSRRDLADVPRSSLGTIYPGTCRGRTSGTDTAIRLLTTNDPVTFDDGLQGPQTQCLESESGDFIVLRRDGLIAYQLAVAVDDAQQGITEVVRGIDLMDSTPRQIHVQQSLGLNTPRYQHIPVAVHADGDKLSKLTGAKGLSLQDPRRGLLLALKSLRQHPPEELATASLDSLWAWAQENWRIDRLRGHTAISTAEQAMAEL